MIQPITLLGAGLVLGALVLKYKSQPQSARKSSSKQIRKTAKILVAAVLAWMTLGYTLQHMIGSIDGQRNQEESFMERTVHFIEKLL